MLIIRIKQEQPIKEKRTKRKERRKLNTNGFIERTNIKVQNDVHSLISLPISCFGDPEFSRLIKTYKGKIISPDNKAINDILKDYQFDIKPYFKRAILSAFVKNLIDDFDSCKTVCIVDNNFRISQEMVDVAKFVRKLVILTNDNIDIQKFSDLCYLNLGTVVSIKNRIETVDWDIYLNFDDMFDDGKIIVKFKNKEALLNPDPEYFLCNESLSDIISYGIPVRIACAAFEIKKQEELDWKFRRNSCRDTDFKFT